MHAKSSIFFPEKIALLSSVNHLLILKFIDLYCILPEFDFQSTSNPVKAGQSKWRHNLLSRRHYRIFQEIWKYIWGSSNLGPALRNKFQIWYGYTHEVIRTKENGFINIVIEDFELFKKNAQESGELISPELGWSSNFARNIKSNFPEEFIKVCIKECLFEK